MPSREWIVGQFILSNSKRPLPRELAVSSQGRLRVEALLPLRKRSVYSPANCRQGDNLIHPPVHNCEVGLLSERQCAPVKQALGEQNPPEFRLAFLNARDQILRIGTILGCVDPAKCHPRIGKAEVG